MAMAYSNRGPASDTKKPPGEIWEASAFTDWSTTSNPPHTPTDSTPYSQPAPSTPYGDPWHSASPTEPACHPRTSCASHRTRSTSRREPDGVGRSSRIPPAIPHEPEPCRRVLPQRPAIPTSGIRPGFANEPQVTAHHVAEAGHWYPPTVSRAE